MGRHVVVVLLVVWGARCTPYRDDHLTKGAVFVAPVGLASLPPGGRLIMRLSSDAPTDRELPCRLVGLNMSWDAWSPDGGGARGPAGFRTWWSQGTNATWDSDPSNLVLANPVDEVVLGRGLGQSTRGTVWSCDDFATNRQFRHGFAVGLVDRGAEAGSFVMSGRVVVSVTYEEKANGGGPLPQEVTPPSEDQQARLDAQDIRVEWLDLDGGWHRMTDRSGAAVETALHPLPALDGGVDGGT